MTGDEEPGDNFASHFESIADLAPDRLAVAAGEKELTWGAFDELADRLAGYLAGHGIRAGNRVGLAAWNRPEYLVALCALFKLGATPVNVNYRYRAGEMRHVLANAEARGVIAEADLLAVVGDAAAEVPGCELIVPLHPEGFGPEVTGADRYPRRTRGDAEWLLFTGGTTGHPKAVLGSHAERVRTLRAGTMATLGLDPAGGVAALRRAVALDPHAPGGMVVLPASPLMHGTGLYTALGALVGGAPVVLLPTRRVTGGDVLAAIARHRVTDLVIVGDAFALRLLDALDRAAEAGQPLGIDSLRRVRSVGAIWSPPVKRRLLGYGDLELIDAIAASEGGMYAVSTVTRATVDAQAGTFALAPGARLLDERDQDVPPGQIGWLAAPVVAGAGYQGDSERTAAAFHDVDGVRYSIPGDMAVLEADGRLRLLGRGSTVINTGGEKVYPEEVELVLREHPAVHDAVVLGVPDARWGSVVAALVSLEAGGHAEQPELAAFVAARLAGYKKPRRVLVVPEVRRLATGKADLRWAADQFAEHSATRTGRRATP
jgi:3-oxocholest-4-en-26-oate---CoA ligase